MKHKLFTLLLAIVASIGTLFAQSGTCGDNLTWDLTNGVLTISGTGAMADYAFDGTTPWHEYIHSAIQSVVIEDGVTSVGACAFYLCTELTNVTISNSVTKIGEGAFQWCPNLSSVTLPNSVTFIDHGAFANCGLTSVTIPSSVTNIGLYVFASCHNLISIEVDANNQNYCSVDGILYNKSQTTIVQYPAGKPATSYSIPTFVNNIGIGAFQGSYNLSSVIIPASVTTIGNDAFFDCDGLTAITIPNSVISIGRGIFSDCNHLFSIDVVEDNPNYSSIDGVLFNKDQTLLIEYPGGRQGEYIIPNSTTSIMEHAFRSCTGLTSITIPSTIVNIGISTFEHCYHQLSVTNYAIVPQTIDENVFGGVYLPVCTLYVPAQSLAAYQAADVWKDFGTILPISGEPEPIETIEADYNVVYFGHTDNELSRELVTLHVPVAPIIEGFSFLKWQVVAGDLENGIIIQAVYQANEPTAAPEVYTNPSNPAQKLIRNGHVYILKGDRIYTIQGQKVK